jgi:hypothetical protein
MEPGDDYVNTYNAQGQTTAVPLVELHDQRERGRLCIPLVGDADRDRLSGRAARRAHLEVRDWLMAIGGLLVICTSVISTIVALLSRGPGK